MLAAPGPPTVAQANTNSPQVSFSRSAYFTGEGESAVVKVVRNGDGKGVVNYTPADASTSSGEATANADYTPASGQVAFDSYETEKSFTVSALQDTEPENAASHIVELPRRRTALDCQTDASDIAPPEPGRPLRTFSRQGRRPDIPARWLQGVLGPLNFSEQNCDCWNGALLFRGRGIGLSAEDDVDASEQQADLRWRDPAHSFLEQRPVESDDL